MIRPSNRRWSFIDRDVFPLARLTNRQSRAVKSLTSMFRCMFASTNRKACWKWESTEAEQTTRVKVYWRREKSVSYHSVCMYVMHGETAFLPQCVYFSWKVTACSETDPSNTSDKQRWVVDSVEIEMQRKMILSTVLSLRLVRIYHRRDPTVQQSIHRVD